MSGATHAAGVRTAVVAGSVLQRWLTTLARVVLGVTLLVAGGIKISNPDLAVKAVQAYQILPYGLTHLVGYGLPLLEVLVGVLLVLGLFTRPAAVVGGLLMVVFVAGIVSVWVRGLSIDCGCFGGGGQVSSVGRNGRYATEVVRDTLLFGLAAWVAWFPRSAVSLDALVGDREPAGQFDWDDGDEDDEATHDVADDHAVRDEHEEQAR
jgi:uncharacterized membrane protein YphA (DoxX/SURF4 family)